MCRRMARREIQQRRVHGRKGGEVAHCRDRPLGRRRSEPGEPGYRGARERAAVRGPCPVGRPPGGHGYRHGREQRLAVGRVQDRAARCLGAEGAAGGCIMSSSPGTRLSGLGLTPTRGSRVARSPYVPDIVSRPEPWTQEIVRASARRTEQLPRLAAGVTEDRRNSRVDRPGMGGGAGGGCGDRAELG